MGKCFASMYVCVPQMFAVAEDVRIVLSDPLGLELKKVVKCYYISAGNGT